MFPPIITLLPYLVIVTSADLVETKKLCSRARGGEIQERYRGFRGTLVYLIDTAASCALFAFFVCRAVLSPQEVFARLDSCQWGPETCFQHRAATYLLTCLTPGQSPSVRIARCVIGRSD